MGVSLSELFVVLIVFILVSSSKDGIIVLKQFKKIYSYFDEMKKNFYKFIHDNNSQIFNKLTEEQSRELNFYLEKIIEMEGKYEGEYEISKIKSYYHKIIILNKKNVKVIDNEK